MEDYRNQFIAIIAGYEAEMKWFLTTNPGLPSRFPIHLQFPDYDVKALLEIARKAAAARQYRLSSDAEWKVRRQLHQLLIKPNHLEPFSNARWIRNSLEHAIRLQAVRLFDESPVSREKLMLLEAADFCWGDAT